MNDETMKTGISKSMASNSICYLCGKGVTDKSDPFTDDHIPPKSLFDILPGQKIIGDLITVKAHKSCNKGHQQDDEYLVFGAIIGAYDASDMARRVFERLYRGFQRPQASKFLRSLVSKMKEINISTPMGIYLGKRPAFEYDAERIQRAIFKMCRGLYFRETGRILPESHPFKVVNAAHIASVRKEAAAKNEFQIICDGVFKFKWVKEESNDLEGYFWISFYDSLDFIGATGTRAQKKQRLIKVYR